jgi:molybdate transport system substrate-binding protein
MRTAALVLAMLAVTGPAAAETIKVVAAGSLREALAAISTAYEVKSGHKIDIKYGASGTLKNEITDGAQVDIFASANMEHPQALFDDGTGGPPVRFARNKMCALVKPGLDVTSANLLERMLDPKIKLATSTPRLDPSGDYAVQVFTKTEALKAGSQAILESKALKLTGARTSAAPPPGRNVYGWHVAGGRADIFLTYCTNAKTALKQYPDQQVVELPEALAVGADYGLTVISGAPDAAADFVEFILSPQGQTILAGFGFDPAQ